MRRQARRVLISLAPRWMMTCVWKDLASVGEVAIGVGGHGVGGSPWVLFGGKVLRGIPFRADFV